MTTPNTETHGKATKDNDNTQQKQTQKQQKKLLRPMAGTATSSPKW